MSLKHVVGGCLCLVAQDELFDYIFSQAVKRELRPLIENKAKFVLCHSNSGHKYGGSLHDVHPYL